LVRTGFLQEAGVLALAGGEDAGADLGGAFGGGAARSSLYCTAGTSMWMSMRSSSGPLTLLT
jgi:hypothetical protein